MKEKEPVSRRRHINTICKKGDSGHANLFLAEEPLPPGWRYRTGED